MWHATCDIWNVTLDKWHVTRDSLGVVNIASKFQVPSSNGLGVIIFWRFDIWHVTCNMWHVTCDIWHVTGDMWHVTFYIWHVKLNIWHVTHDSLVVVNIASKFQGPSSNGLGVMKFWRLDMWDVRCEMWDVTWWSQQRWILGAGWALRVRYNSDDE